MSAENPHGPTCRWGDGRGSETVSRSEFGSGSIDNEVAPALAKNVIFMVPDGFGDAAATAYRYFKGTEEPPAWEHGLQASVQTHSASSPVTDSAAAATAYATGVKTYNGGIAVDVDGNPLVSVLDLASEAGKATGIVTTDAVTGATPAAFAASNVDRAIRTRSPRSTSTPAIST